MFRALSGRLWQGQPLLQRRLAACGIRCYNITPTTRPKRFYKVVDVKRNDDKKGGWLVTLDGRVLKTPAKARFVVPSEQLALSIALEWDAQRPVVRPFLMPMTQLCATVIDRMPTARPSALTELLNYFDSDTLCHDLEDPAELRERQQRFQGPLVSWFAQHFGEAPSRASGFGAVEHSVSLRSAVAKEAAALDDWRLVGLHSVAATAKSAICGFAILHGGASVDEAIAAARVEEEYQAGRWGVVEGSHDIDRAAARVSMHAAQLMLSLLPPTV